MKEIQVPTFESDYRDNIQLQFNDDQKFVELVQTLCEYGIEYQETLAALSNAYKLDPSQFTEVTDQNTFILNSIGQFLNLPPMEYFDFPSTPYQYYIRVIQGQQAKNAYDGTNQSLINVLNTTFAGQYQFILEDTGKMSLKVYLVPLGTTQVDPVDEELFNNGWFVPKPAGVNIEYQVSDQIYFGWDITYQAGPPQITGWDNGVWFGIEPETQSNLL